MGQGLQLNVTLGVTGAYTGNASIGAVSDSLNLKETLAYVTGAGAGAADTLYTESLNIAASSNVTRDLTSLTDPLGNAVDFARVKAIVVIAASGNTNNIVVGAAASNAFAGPLGAGNQSFSVPPGGIAAFARDDAAGWVTSSTSKVIEIANSGAGSAVTGSLIVIGAAE